MEDPNTLRPLKRWKHLFYTVVKVYTDYKKEYFVNWLIVIKFFIYIPFYTYTFYSQSLTRPLLFFTIYFVLRVITTSFYKLSVSVGTLSFYRLFNLLVSGLVTSFSLGNHRLYKQVKEITKRLRKGSREGRKE